MPNNVSVIIVSHNRGNLLPGAIDSVLSQKFFNFELIIIDDASTDHTAEVVEKYLTDRRVKYYKIKKGSSIAQARNAAWPHVAGKYIAVLDSDDLWSDNLKLEKQFNFLEKNLDVVLVGSGALLIDSEGRELSKVFKPESNSDIKKDFLIKNPFFHSSVMYRFEAIGKIGGYDEKIRFGEDLDLWLRLGKIGQLHNLPEIMIKYRVHGDNESSKHWFGAILDVLRVIKKNRQIYGINRLVFLRKILVKLLEYFKKR